MFRGEVTKEPFMGTARLRRYVVCGLVVTVGVGLATAQERGSAARLTLEGIAQDPAAWIGAKPTQVRWSEDSESIYFMWNPEAADLPELYVVPRGGGTPTKVPPARRRFVPAVAASAIAPARGRCTRPERRRTELPHDGDGPPGRGVAHDQIRIGIDDLSGGHLRRVRLRREDFLGNRVGHSRLSALGSRPQLTAQSPHPTADPCAPRQARRSTSGRTTT